MKPRRYQLRKDTIEILAHHPWIFREQMSSAAQVFADGTWLRLYDGQNRVIGHGIYESEGAIAIRVLRRGHEAPDAAWVRAQVTAAIARRSPLLERTTAMRLVHGESDGLSAVVIDRFGDTLVAQSYSTGADALARYAVRLVRQALQAAGIAIEHVVMRPARRRRGEVGAAATLHGSPPEVVQFVEDGLPFAVDLEGGQKSGAYLDLRGLRRAIAIAPLAGASVLNLFAYSGMLGLAAESAGAARIMQVDQSDRALTFASAHHVRDPARHTFVVADVFEWLPTLSMDEQFEVAIVDPPAMTSQMKQIPTALAAYRKLYGAVAPHIKPGGIVFACCCTSRIDRALFHKTVAGALGPEFVHQVDLPLEPDHPVGFAQADYLKIAMWRRAGTAG